MAILRVGINGFGRIGRVVFRTCFERQEFEVVAINDPAVDVDYIRYLMKYDSTHGKFKGEVTYSNDEVIVDGKKVKVFHQKSPASIPWHTVGVQYVVEASGLFTTREKASGHLASGTVKRVIVTAPCLDIPMVILGVNDEVITAEQKIISSGSSTLYCLAPVIKVLEDKYGLKDGFVTSIHAMTPSLKPLDGLCLRGKHWRDCRGIHQNIIPATTGACRALESIIPSVKDKLAGLGFRVPIINVSVLDLTVRLESDTSLVDIMNSFETMSKSTMKNIIDTSKDAAVSSDFIGDSHSCILDENSSLELKPNYFKLVCWYENEYSYACRIADLILFCEKQYRSSILIKATLLKLKKKQSRKEINNRLNIKINSHHECGPIIKMIPINVDQHNSFSLKCPVNEVICNSCKVNNRRLFLRPFSPTSRQSSTNTTPIIKKTNKMSKVWNEDARAGTSRDARQNLSTLFERYPAPICKKCNNKHNKERQEDNKNDVSTEVNITEEVTTTDCGEEGSQTNEVSGINKRRSNSEINTTEINTEPSMPLNSHEITSLYRNQEPDVSSEATVDEKLDLNGTCECDRLSDITTKSTKSIYHEIKHKFYRDNASTVSDRSNRNSPVNRKFIRLQEISLGENTSQTTEELYYDNKGTETNLERTENSQYSTEINSRQRAENTHDGIENNQSEGINASISNIKPLSKAVEAVRLDCKKKCLSKKSIMQPLKEEPSWCNEFGKIINTQTEQIIDLCNQIKKDNQPNTSWKQKFANIMKKFEDLNKMTSKSNIDDINQTNIEDSAKEQDETHKHTENNRIQKNYITDKNLTEEIAKENVEQETIDSQHKRDPDPITGKCQQHDELCINDSSFLSPPVRQSITNEKNLCPLSVTKYKDKKDKINNIPDIYDKLDSCSGTDSEDSIARSKSNVINITDLTSSVEDLDKIDKICRIIEISDDLSNILFSNLDSKEETEIPTSSNKEWTVQDLCEKIKLDEFCNKVFHS